MHLRTLVRPARASLALAAVACALSAPPAPASQPRGFFGVQSWATPTSAELDAMGRSRVDVFRFNLEWSSVEPLPGRRVWGRYDDLVAGAARNAIRLLPVLYGSPPFAAAHATDPPLTRAARAAFTRFAADAVRRYGRGGAFWRLHPELPYFPILTWQIWNEPNFAAYWNGHPDPRQYLELVRAVRGPIRHVDPRARIALAGLPESRGGMPIARFLGRLYDVRGASRLFEVVAVNPYARDERGVVGAVRRVRAIMDRHRDRRTPIIVTEIGWATGGPPGPFRTSLRAQASLLTRSYASVLRLRKRCRVETVVWFSWRDRALYAGEHDWWAPHTGLFTLAGKAKPAWRAFVGLTGGSAL
ncbi:MAG: hypothetical protein JSS99_04935 [Actinobacteria bacterium]|nr:hypothetical protein [Actinomycetota bacterium]